MRSLSRLALLAVLCTSPVPSFASAIPVSRIGAARAGAARVPLAQRLRRPFVGAIHHSVRFIGGSVDRVADALESRRFHALGRTLRYLGGTATLEKTSLALSMSFVVAPPLLHYVGNAGGGVNFWTGSAEYWRHSVKTPGDIHFDFYGGMSTAIGGIGRSRAAGMTRSLRLPYVGATESRRHFALNLGLPNVLIVGFGEVAADLERPGSYDRGPYVGLGGSIPLGLARIGVGFGLYYPPFALLTTRLRRPAAYLRGLEQRIAGWFRRKPPDSGDHLPQKQPTVRSVGS